MAGIFAALIIVLAGFTPSARAQSGGGAVSEARSMVKASGGQVAAVAPKTVAGKEAESCMAEVEPTLYSYYRKFFNMELLEVDYLPVFTNILKFLGTPYRYGGRTTAGTDCSGFSGQLFELLFPGLVLARSAAGQFMETQRLTRDQLRTGDLVFFYTMGRYVSHVGVYLKDGKFIHAATCCGVMISHLDEDYYKRRWAGAGRVIGANFDQLTTQQQALLNAAKNIPGGNGATPETPAPAAAK